MLTMSSIEGRMKSKPSYMHAIYIYIYRYIHAYIVFFGGGRGGGVAELEGLVRGAQRVPEEIEDGKRSSREDGRCLEIDGQMSLKETRDRLKELAESRGMPRWAEMTKET